MTKKELMKELRRLKPDGKIFFYEHQYGDYSYFLDKGQVCFDVEIEVLHDMEAMIKVNHI